MSLPTLTSVPNLPRRKRLTREDYHHLSERGFFQDDDRIELIEGELVEMAAKGTAHTVCCRQLLQQLPILLQGQALVQCQDPIVQGSIDLRQSFAR